MQPGEPYTWLLPPPVEADRERLAAVAELLRQHRPTGPVISDEPVLDLAVGDDVVPLPGQVTAALGHMVEALLAGYQVLLVPQHIKTHPDLRK